jgi:signal peptidase II
MRPRYLGSAGRNLITARVYWNRRFPRALPHLPSATVMQRGVTSGVALVKLSAPTARVFLPLFAGVFLSDCASKRVAVEQLSPAYVSHDVVGDVLRFTLAYNKSSAMGVLSAGAHSRWILAALATVMLLTVSVWLLRTKSEDPVLFGGIALVAAGALGNLVDRLRWDRGVVDFIDIGLGDTRFYIFNVADMAITFGAVVLWYAMRDARQTQPARHRHASDE